MDKKPSNLVFPDGLPPFVSEEADIAQWNRGPRVLGPSIAERILAQHDKATTGPQAHKSATPATGATS